MGEEREGNFAVSAPTPSGWSGHPDPGGGRFGGEREPAGASRAAASCPGSARPAGEGRDGGGQCLLGREGLRARGWRPRSGKLWSGSRCSSHFPPGSRGSPKSTPGVEPRTDARSDHSEAEAPAPRPGLASRSPSTRRTRSLRQHLPGAHCAPACQDLGAQPRRRDTRPHGKRSHSARLPVQALLTGALGGRPPRGSRGQGPPHRSVSPPAPPPLVKFRALQWGVPSSQQETGYSLCQSSVPPQGDSRRPLEPQLCPRAAWGAGVGAVGCGGSAVHTCGVSTLSSE